VHTTQLADYAAGFESKGDEVLPAFIRYDCLKDSVTEIAPAARPEITLAPEEFGDDWSECLSAEDHRQVDAYFRSVLHLRTFLDFVNVRVGGQDHVIDLEPGGFGRGLTFEVPRQSLMTSVRYGLFDDLLIGNFMRTVFHGRWKEPSLYPDFSPYVAKYGDNAGAKTPEALQRYFRAYRDRAPVEYFRHQLSHRLHRVFEEGAINVFRSFVPLDSRAYRLVKFAYRAVKRPRLT
jgi:hypothetical protein